MEVVRQFFQLLLLFAIALFVVDLARNAQGVTAILGSIFGEVNQGYGYELAGAGLPQPGTKKGR